MCCRYEHHVWFPLWSLNPCQSKNPGGEAHVGPALLGLSRTWSFPYSCRQWPPRGPEVVLDSATQVHLPFTSLFGRFRILPLHWLLTSWEIMNFPPRKGSRSNPVCTILL